MLSHREKDTRNPRDHEGRLGQDRITEFGEPPLKSNEKGEDPEVGEAESFSLAAGEPHRDTCEKERPESCRGQPEMSGDEVKKIAPRAAPRMPKFLGIVPNVGRNQEMGDLVIEDPRLIGKESIKRPSDGQGKAEPEILSESVVTHQCFSAIRSLPGR